MRITPNLAFTIKQPLLKKKAGLLAIATLAVIAAPSIGVYWWTMGRYIETSDDAYVHADVVSVRAGVSGDIVSVAVQDNQSVHKGQILARLDDAEYQAHVIRAQAAVDVASAALREDAALPGAGSTGMPIADGSGQFGVDAFKTVQQGVAAARAQAQVDVARVALRLAQRDLARTAIYAATDGVISDSAARAGQHVGSNQPLMTIVPMDKLCVIARFKEGDLAAIHPGQRVDINLDGFFGMTLRGYVASIAPGSSARAPARDGGDVATTGRGIAVEIAFEKTSIANGALRNGMPVNVRVHTDHGGSAST